MSDPSLEMRLELENQLGLAQDFILTDKNWQQVRSWAIAAGHIRFDRVASGPELANLYHQHGPNAKPLDPMTLLLASLHRTGFAPLDVDRVTDLIRDNWRSWSEVITDQITLEIEKAKLPGPPIVIEVRSPAGNKVLPGLQHEMTPEVIQVASMGHDLMLVGPAGCGKTMIGKMVSIALDLPFYITSTVFDTHELLGFVDGAGHYHSTSFRKAFQNGGVWVADELDAWDAAALLSINSALANGFATFPDSEAVVNRHADFRIIATANTFGKGADRVYVGRNELDAASLDRFAVIEVDYDSTLESHLCGGQIDWYMHVVEIRRLIETKNIRHVASTRAIKKGSEALSIGMAWNRVNEIYLLKGMSASDRKKILQ